MNFKIVISILLAYCVLFIKGWKELTFVKEQCLECCENISEATARNYTKLHPNENAHAAYLVLKNDCKESCEKKYAKLKNKLVRILQSQVYQNRKTCLDGCRGILKVCRSGCDDACNFIFAKRKPNKFPPGTLIRGKVPKSVES